jgi:hypothetical protein
LVIFNCYSFIEPQPQLAGTKINGKYRSGVEKRQKIKKKLSKSEGSLMDIPIT